MTAAAASPFDLCGRSGAAGVRPDGEGGSGLPSPKGETPKGWALIELPAPPSVNNAFKNVRGRGRVKAEPYRDWESNAGWRLRLSNPPRFAEPVVVVIGCERHSLAADIDNRLKLTLDLLVAHQVLRDDRDVVALAAAWNPPGSSLIRIAIAPATDGIALCFHLADSSGAYGGWFLTAPSGENHGLEPD